MFAARALHANERVRLPSPGAVSGGAPPKSISGAQGWRGGTPALRVLYGGQLFPLLLQLPAQLLHLLPLLLNQLVFGLHNGPLQFGLPGGVTDRQSRGSVRPEAGSPRTVANAGQWVRNG